MAYKVIILYRLYMPSYFLGTFTEYPYLMVINIITILSALAINLPTQFVCSVFPPIASDRLRRCGLFAQISLIIA